MKKIISDKKKSRLKRNREIIAYYEAAMANGSDKTAVYKYLANRYNFKRYQSICNIINEHYKDKSSKK